MYTLFFGNVFFLNWSQFFNLFYNNLLLYFSSFIYKIFFFNFLKSLEEPYFFIKNRFLKNAQKPNLLHLFFCPFFFRNFQYLDIFVFQITNRYVVYDLVEFGFLGDTFMSYFIFLKLVKEKNLILNIKKSEIFFNLNDQHKAILFKKKTWYFWRKRTLYSYCKEFAIG